MPSQVRDIYATCLKGLLTELLLQLGSWLQAKAQIFMVCLHFVVWFLPLCLLWRVGSLIVLSAQGHALGRLDRYGRQVLLGGFL